MVGYRQIINQANVDSKPLSVSKFKEKMRAKLHLNPKQIKIIDETSPKKPLFGDDKLKTLEELSEIAYVDES